MVAYDVGVCSAGGYGMADAIVTWTSRTNTRRMCYVGGRGMPDAIITVIVHLPDSCTGEAAALMSGDTAALRSADPLVRMWVQQLFTADG